MSISGLGTLHLQQTKLGEKAVELLEPLATWISTLGFTPHAGGFEVLAHTQLREKINPLLTELGLLNKVLAHIKCCGLRLITQHRLIP